MLNYFGWLVIGRVYVSGVIIGKRQRKEHSEMIEKIDLEKEPFKETNKCIDTLNRLWIIGEKLNEVIDAVNKKEKVVTELQQIILNPFARDGNETI